MIHPILSQAEAGATASHASSLASDLWHQVTGDGWFVLWLCLLQLAFLGAAWIAARALVPRRELNSFGQYDRREGGGLGKAIGLYLAYLLLLWLGSFLLRLTGPEFQLTLLGATTGTTTPGTSGLFKVGALAALALLLILALPILIFRIHLSRAITMLLLILVLVSGAGWALDRALHRAATNRFTAIRAWAAAQNGTVLHSAHSSPSANVAFDTAERTAQDTTKPMAERKAAVRSLYEQVSDIRRNLQEGDTTGIAEYQRQNARYETMLKSLREEIAANPQAP